MSTVEFSEGLFDIVPEEHRESFSKKCLDLFKDSFFVYGVELFEYKCQFPHIDDKEESYILVKSTICKTIELSLLVCEETVYFESKIDNKRSINRNFTFKGKPVFRVDKVFTTPEIWYKCSIETPLVEERAVRLSNEVNQENARSSGRGTKRKRIGKLSDDGWKWFKERMVEICKDDPGGPENMLEAIYFVGKEISQRKKTENQAYKNAARKYEVPEDTLMRRCKARFSTYRWANDKHPK